MTALVRKEIRLLLPAWITAMLLIIAPIPLGPLFEYYDSVTNAYASGTTRLTIFGLAVGCCLLGLTGFGREMSSRTFSLLLAQPRPRREYWRAKIGVLLGSLVMLALFLGLVSWQFVPALERTETALTWFIIAGVAVTGGLWTTLLFRQIIASFWISVLTPVAILVPFASLISAMRFDDAGTEARAFKIVVTVLLLAYSVAGYWFARWQFWHAQDTAWTGGNLSLPSIERWLPWKRTETVRPKMHPLWALLGKEFHFQQVSFLLAGLLLLVQVAVLLVQKFVKLNENSGLAMIVQHFWGIWIVMPLLVGCSAVAEERKLATLEPQLCLPVSRAWQFAVKVFVTLVCGTVFGALVPVLVDVINPGRGSHPLEFAAGWTLACICLTFVSLYASSITQQLLQAVGAAIGIIIAALILGNWFLGSFSRGRDAFSLFGATLWQGPLVLFVGAGVMLLFAIGHTWRRLRWFWASLLALLAVAVLRGKIPSLLGGGLSTNSTTGFNALNLVGMVAALCPVALTVALAAKNFNHTQTSLALWWRNAATWLICLVLTGIVTTLVYNRVWELAMPFEPPAGAPRLSGPVQPVVTHSFVDRPSFVLLPDGRLCSYKEYELISPPITQTNSSQAKDSLPIWHTSKHPRVEFVGGSNWVTIAPTYYEFFGVKSDGSLWRAFYFERVDKEGNVATRFAGSPAPKGSTLRPTGLKFERFGNESVWAAVAASEQHCVALKRDGTIWGWGDNWNQQLGDGPKSFTNAPVQLGQATNWTAVYAGYGQSYAVNREKEIWKWGKFTANIKQRKVERGPVKLNIKVPGVRDVSASGNDLDLILDTDGNLWGLGIIPPALRGEGHSMEYYSEPRRLGGTNWFSVSCNWQALTGLQTDGTLWLQRGRNLYNWPLPKLVQLGKRSDWLAVKLDWEAELALAKDGTLCRFGDQASDHRMALLAPTRRVTWSLNLLDAAK